MNILNNLIFSRLSLVAFVALAVIGICAWWLVRNMQHIAMERRIQRVLKSSVSIRTAENQLELEKQNLNTDLALTNLLPSIKSSQKKLRQAGNIMSVRTYTIILVLSGIIAAYFFAFPGVPHILMPFVFWIVFFYIGDKGILSYLVNRRKARIVRQIPQMVDYIVRSIRVGQSLEMALRSAVPTIGGPLGEEMSIVPKLLDIGSSIDYALTKTSEQLDVPDFEFFVNACVAQQQSGGDLAGVLKILSKTVRSRLALFQEISAMTAEGRVTVVFMACLPIGLFVYLNISNPKYVEPFYNSDLGHILLYLVFILIAIGTIVSWRLAQIKD